MKAYKLIAGTAAALLTLASLRAVLYNVEVWQPTNNSISTPTTHVTDLAPVVVHPSATEKREAALINDAPIGIITLPAGADSNADASMQPLNLLRSQLVMPYYSFGKTFGRVTKE